MAVYLEAVRNYRLSRVRTAIEHAISEIGVGIGGAKSAVIKPNIVQPRSPETGIVTHPVVVEALVDALMDRGVRNITIAEGPALGVNVQRAFRVSGFAELAKRKGVDLLDIFDAPRTEVSLGYGYDNLPNVYDEEDLPKYECGFLRIPSVVLESDLYINVAKLKTHNRTAVSLAMKNQWALLGFSDRQMYHRVGLHEPIAQLARAVQPHITIIDGIIGLEGNGPVLGKPVPAGILAVGDNLVETDIVGSRLVGQDPYEVVHIARAVELGLSGWEVDVRGRAVGDLAIRFQPAPLDLKRNHNFYLWRNHRACHLDDDAFNLAVTMAKKNPRYWRFLFNLAYYTVFRRIDVVRGRGNRMPEFSQNQRIIVSGECARDLISNYEEMPENVVFVPGCPPKPEDIIEAIMRM